MPAIKMWVVRVLTLLTLAVPLAMGFVTNTITGAFWTIFIFRYARHVGNFVGYYMYRPYAISAEPSFGRKDVTVVLPTVEPAGVDFEPCVRSILENDPGALLVVTVGHELQRECERVLSTLRVEFEGTRISVSNIPNPSKRRQVAHAMPQVTTPVTILADDHVFWPKGFVPSVLAPLEDKKVGVVGTKKRVRRTTPGAWSAPSVVNFIACNYLERHNWELRASNAIDGGVFVVSGRTAVYRTSFLQDADLLARYTNERFFFGVFGKEGLGPDDDNFLTREAMKKGWAIRFQDTAEGTMETTLGEWPKFRGQLLRWARTTFRSNPVMLRDVNFLYRYTWSFFMVYWAMLVNFALLWDAAMITLLVLSPGTGWLGITCLVLLIVASKTYKITAHLERHPADCKLLVAQIAFAYIHSAFKFWALVTFWDCDWSGRKLDEVGDGDGDTGVGSRGGNQPAPWVTL